MVGNRQQTRGKKRGFTLIELMIVVVIVGILAAVAYPSYQQHVIRTHRNAAKACLMEYAQFLERHYTANMTYVGAEPSPPCRNEGQMGQRYAFELVEDALGPRSYTATARPINAQLKSDTRCGTLGLTHTGARTATGAGGVSECW